MYNPIYKSIDFMIFQDVYKLSEHYNVNKQYYILKRAVRIAVQVVINILYDKKN